MKNKKWMGFFTNLLGVILGILLTFGVNSLWQRNEEKKKTKEMLTLLRNELEINKEWFKIQENSIKEDCYVYRKLLEANKNWKSFPVDTLTVYRDQLNTRTFSQLSTSAWQIFQNSEIIQKMTNKELVIMLTSCYNMIDIIKEFLEKYYWDRKEKATNVFELDLYEYLDAVMNNKESVYFFDRMDKSTTFWDAFITIDTMIDYTLFLLDRDGYYQFDLDETGKALKEFFEARMDSELQKNDTIVNDKNNNSTTMD